MKSLPSPAPLNSIEPLEGRIAPAVIHIGATGNLENATDTEYHEDISAGSRPDQFDDLNFIDTATSTDAISLAVNPLHTPGIYYIRLDAGDSIQRLTLVNAYQDLIVVKSGSAIAYFTDDGDNEYQEGEFTGLSLSGNALLEINGPVFGDIVTNLDTKGTRAISDDVVDMGGLIGPKQGIRSLFVGGGTVSGSIYSGGDINSLTITNGVDGVYAGAAADGHTFDFSPLAGGEGLISFQPGVGVAGANIRNTEIGTLDVLAAGGGGIGAAGGSLTNIKITSDNDGFMLLAGAGGDASAVAGKLNGGNGGSITKVLVAGLPDPASSFNSDVLIKAGAGGDGTTTGKGGNGGGVRDVRVGFEVNGGIVNSSSDLLHDNIRIEAGAGGSGKIGGTGGSGSSVFIYASTPDELGGDVELAVVAGKGGDSVSPGGKTGAGGSLSSIEVRNQILTTDTDILIQAGAAGDVIPAGGASAGNAGGSLSKIKVLGSEIQFVAGDGANGKTGGNGGSLSSITVLDDDAIFPQSVLLAAGRGGDGTAGNAGNGGEIKTVLAPGVDLTAMLINPGTGGNGGNSVGGKGGRGGSLTNISVSDIDSPADPAGTLDARAGLGGDGDLGGGAGGAVRTFTVDALDLNLFVAAGAGGNALLNGSGGAGGAMTAVQLVSSGTVNGVDVTGGITAGRGGNAAGTGKAGGAGGGVSTSMLNVSGDPLLPALGDGSIIAGAGGNGSAGTGAAGAGGSITSSAVFASDGSGSIIAGDAGTVGGKPGKGGSITGTVAVPIGLRSDLSLTAIAGDGSFGGAGGNIVNLSFGNGGVNADPLTPTPAGSILIQAGAGSQGLNVAGRGGSLTNINGGASSGVNQSVTLLAGDGGGDVRTGAAAPFNYTGSGKAAAGGSITNVTLVNGGAAGGLVTFEAGDGGHSGAAATGAAGGSISGVGISNLSTAAVLRSFGAGDGGDAVRTGGSGGSVLNVEVLGHDIGERTGKVYGYTQMGGIFAGTGGLGAVTGKAGSVIGVSADSIASIVAGKGDIPQLAEKISNVTLNASNQLLFRNNSFVPGATFQLTYNGQTTGDIPGNATAAQLAAALNQLPDVANAGGITVATFTSDGGYVVQFGSSQVTTTDASLTAAELEAALELLPTVNAKGGVTTSDQLDGSIHIRIGTDPNPGNDQIIPAGATTQQIAAALNATGLNAFGAFAVTQKTIGGIPGDYTITYKTTGFGDQMQITGVENVPVKVVQKLQGAIAQFQTSESQTGQFGLSTTETRSGSEPVSVQETVRGQFNFVATEITVGVTGTTPEVQQFTLDPVSGYPTAQFTLSFNGEQTGLISTAGSDVAIAAAADAALEALANVQALSGPVGNKVQVAPSASGPRTFNVTYAITDGDVVELQGSYLLPETQRIELGTLALIGGSTFQITFGNSTTGNLSSTPTPAQIDAALELLPDIVALNGPAGNKVAVTQVTPHTFDITFNSNGDKISFSGATALPEIQTLDLASALAVPGGKIRLFFDFASTFSNEVTPDLTPGADDAATAIIIKNALNNLDSVKATNAGNTGSVNVAALGNGRFTVSFTANGEQNNIVATAYAPEIQHFDLNGINTIGNSQFTLDVKTSLPLDETRQYTVVDSFRGTVTRDGLLNAPAEFDTNLANGTGSTPEIFFVNRTFMKAGFPTTGQIEFTFNNGVNPPVRFVGASATAGQIDATIEALTGLTVTINVAGTTTVYPNGSIPDTFDIRFTAVGDRPNLSARGFVPETQRLDLTNLEGQSNTVLSFQNQNTIVLANSPGSVPPLTAVDVQNALNQLPAVAALGGVTVASAGGNLVDVTFGNTSIATPKDVTARINGAHEVLEKQTLDLSRIQGTGAKFTLTANGLTTAQFDEFVTAGALQAALDPIYDDGSALNGTNDIVVTQTGPTKFEIAFTTLRGDIAPIVALATLNGGKSARIPGGADAATIEAALDAVTVGGVTVTAPGLVGGVPVPGSFDVKFNDLGDQPIATVTTYIHEVQTADVYDVGQFFLRSGVQSTGLLNPPITINDPSNPTPAETAALDAAALAVENALNALPSIQAIGNVTVKPAKQTIVINGVPTDVYENTAFDITFLGDGDQTSLSGTQPEVMPTLTKIQGSATTPERQEIHYFAKNAFSAARFAAANLVGAIVDIDEHNANRFHFVNLDGSVDGLNNPTFTLGDRPIDGIVMAKFFDQATVNFTPEARLTASGFFDNDNLL